MKHHRQVDVVFDLGKVLIDWNPRHLFVDHLGAIPQVVIPAGSVILLVPISLLIANLIAVLPGRSAGRTKPSIVLRAE